MSTALTLAEAAEATWLGQHIAESTVLFPALEGVHLLGLALSVGLIGLTDLRLLGWLLRDVPAAAVHRQLRPWVLSGFALMFGSGVLLFFAEAVTLVNSPAFPFKLLFIALAGVNALVFELRLARHLPGPHDATAALPEASAADAAARAALPGAVRAAAAASLLLWLAVVVCGRLIPYLPH